MAVLSIGKSLAAVVDPMRPYSSLNSTLVRSVATSLDVGNVSLCRAPQGPASQPLKCVPKQAYHDRTPRLEEQLEANSGHLFDQLHLMLVLHLIPFL